MPSQVEINPLWHVEKDTWRVLCRQFFIWILLNVKQNLTKISSRVPHRENVSIALGNGLYASAGFREIIEQITMVYYVDIGG